ncbi:PLP-dependent aminotransferase family protein [Chimaeribacter arupi]|nr:MULTISPECIES: PLP-dependent aminotransferase family protein [Yersiniaceae]MDV5140778.1 PLP-dependent aminotransferase family protein [Chimaeribacter arupi]WKZ93541.1 PLP-dependent aminotransferase family protein [Chimaeribacter arupi]
MLSLMHFQRVEGLSKVNQLVAFIAQAVDEGTLGPGSRLPSLREFCEQLSVSKYTVVDALERLRARGLVTSVPGRGYFISRDSVPGGPAAPAAQAAADLHTRLKRAFATNSTLLRPGCGFFPEAWLDTGLFRKALRHTLRTPRLRFMEYGHPLGYLPLRQTLQMKLADAGLQVPADNLILTSSTMNAVDLLLRVLVTPGDTVLLDDLCYFNFTANLRQHRANVVFVPRGHQGVTPAALEALLIAHRPKVFITSGLMHNPTGHSYALGEMVALITLLNRYGCHLIEDDLYHDLMEGAPPPMAALAGLANASYISGFSKLLSANMRVGYIAANPALTQAITQLKSLTGSVTCEFTEQALCQFFRDGSYYRHQRRLVSRLAESSARVTAWLQAAGCRFPVRHTGGLFLWAHLPAHVNAEALAEQALAEGIALAPGSLFGGGQHEMRFNIAHSDDPMVSERVTALLA